MGLKIKNASPFFPDYIKEIDFDDFEKIDVGIKGEKNSNHFYGNYGICLMFNMLL